MVRGLSGATQGDRTIEAVYAAWRRALDVCIRSGYSNFELSTGLTGVDSAAVGKLCAAQSALDIRGTGWIRATSSDVWVHNWVPFEVDVESNTGTVPITYLLAPGGVICLQRAVT